MLDPLEEMPESIKTVKVYWGDNPWPSWVMTREEWNEEVACANPIRAIIRREAEAAAKRLDSML